MATKGCEQNKRIKYKTLRSYRCRGDNEMSFSKGEELFHVNSEEEDDFWVLVKKGKRQGWVPKEYLREAGGLHNYKN